MKWQMTWHDTMWFGDNGHDGLSTRFFAEWDLFAKGQSLAGSGARSFSKLSSRRAIPSTTWQKMSCCSFVLLTDWSWLSRRTNRGVRVRWNSPQEECCPTKVFSTQRARRTRPQTNCEAIGNVQMGGKGNNWWFYVAEFVLLKPKRGSDVWEAFWVHQKREHSWRIENKLAVSEKNFSELLSRSDIWKLSIGYLHDVFFFICC